MDLNQKVALVTGGTRGIGLATVRLLAEQGTKVYMTARSQPSEDLQAYIDNTSNVVFASMDIADADSVQQVVNQIIETDTAIDILVNNAGITKDMLLTRMKLEDFEQVVNVNLVGTFNVTKAVLKGMQKKRQGAIVNISSISGTNGNAGQANYSASKAGIIGLTKTTAREGIRRNVRCNAIAPGMIETDMTDKLSDKIKTSIEESIPAHRFGKPEEIAQTVQFLIENEFITGQTIVVDGGMTI
ncbi:3-oxoacyl-[acyl-carrier-protein] reductase [Pediococcus claussenii]|uniref:3-oxoacyl-[acyl-carrier-protein] reductase n=1 Tax=Pediococcus claussenii (strain ATCC BAA-344 / DSM 14800 / JCM 18046 / KCTC 3811 / LMG 21948 / P06) TaxID=701521 RepID=G8PEQ6_PEDCP|nr:3-oxoacyl-[acyl-carrier-protein] reductase [Pediococcus claussenii]AEV94436.1 3-oxoacyl-[acyl-carrier-protein] reductase [Pediococcus claussenii ATCC BAA-344]ANZ69655.1 beta-ketoacyl-ACP reductase [Pediococcus claussenii]ANZ71472.1 beta-ketoacyl-ACP reductase [Pediococcus claussenii]KRN19860.1 fabG protein [Pediococcus claussenii]